MNPRTNFLVENRYSNLDGLNPLYLARPGPVFRETHVKNGHFDQKSQF